MSRDDRRCVGSRRWIDWAKPPACPLGSAELEPLLARMASKPAQSQTRWTLSERISRTARNPYISRQIFFHERKWTTRKERKMCNEKSVTKTKHFPELFDIKTIFLRFSFHTFSTATANPWTVVDSSESAIFPRRAMRYPYVRVPVETEEAPAQWSKDVDHERRRHQLLLCSSDNVVSFHAPR